MSMPLTAATDDVIRLSSPVRRGLPPGRTRPCQPARGLSSRCDLVASAPISHAARQRRPRRGPTRRGPRIPEAGGVPSGHSWSEIAAPDDIAVSLDRWTGVTGEGDGTVTVRAGTRLRLALVAHGGVLHRGELPATGLGHPELGHPEPAGDGLPVVGALGLDQVDAYAGVAVRTDLGVGGLEPDLLVVGLLVHADPLVPADH